LRTTVLLRLRGTGSCRWLSILAERGQDGGQFDQARDADLGRPKRHAGAVALVEHPVRQLAAEIRPLISVDALKFLAARTHPAKAAVVVDADQAA